MWMTPAGGIILMIATGAGFFLFRDVYAFSGTLVPAGGWVGSAVAGFLLTYANSAGCIIVLAFFSVIGFIFATGISMVTLGRVISQKTMAFASGVNRQINTHSRALRQRVEEWKLQRSERLNTPKPINEPMNDPGALLKSLPCPSRKKQRKVHLKSRRIRWDQPFSERLMTLLTKIRRTCSHQPLWPRKSIRLNM